MTTAVIGVFAGCNESTSPKTTVSGSLVESGAGDYPHKIRIDNSLDHDVTVTVTVKRDSSKVYQETHTVAAQMSRTVAGITKTRLAGNDQSVTVIAKDTTGQSTEITASVSNCLGNIIFFFNSDEELNSTYAIC
ncbi:hypothetical protein [Halorussus sp. MSC15.2]|uniref:hypothetical protein n=1 Tax=Halorussus sp. MSC15.2 TaxID=2283638 RepID=UPI0013D187E2|nr:hypothetical protein [Halorussus sp. MSC15.2]NEU58784.1 hypothetical protein [Halorussus sp. MSC15.2]